MYGALKQNIIQHNSCSGTEKARVSQTKKKSCPFHCSSMSYDKEKHPQEKNESCVSIGTSIWHGWT